MSKGMTEGQKARTRGYLDEFKDNNGGCIICGKKAAEFFFDPSQSEAGLPVLTMYGSCAAHTLLSNSDELLAKAVADLTPTALPIAAGKPNLVIVSFTEAGEDLQYATREKK